MKNKNHEWKYNTEIFIKKANEIYGEKYDYSKVNYVNSKTKVTIICPIHGEFTKTPAKHLWGQGCPGELLNTESFSEKASKKHGEKYDYSKVNYVNSKTKVTIICPIHGEFYQLPHKHLCGYGCPKCGGNIRLTDKIFIENSKKYHGEKYDYSKVNYVNNNTKVTIACPIHGDFKQAPDKHMIGQGCPKCRDSKGEKAIGKFLNKYNIVYEFQKIFSDCRNINPLPFDFYIDEYRTCIEFDGELHYEPSRRKNGEIKLKKAKINDEIKNNFCRDSDIKLIRISYRDYDHIEEILSENFKDKINKEN